jgi:hypothetical protein
MSWASIAKHVGQAAPLLGTVLGGPAGGAVGALISSALGVDNDPSAVANAMASPETLVTLKQIESDHRAQLEQMALEQTKAELADKANARDAHKHSPVPAFIVAGLTILIGILICLIWFAELPTESKTMAMMLLGAVTTKWGDSIAYFVGTTRSSAEKTRLLK